MKIIEINDSAHQVIYLGYIMPLSPVEYKVFMCIYESGDEFISSEHIMDKCFGTKGNQKGVVATHISNINSKAWEIGGRRLIISKYGIGYKITEHP